MDRKTVLVAMLTALVTSAVVGGIRPAIAQQVNAAPNGVECGAAAQSEKAAQWIKTQLEAGRTHILFGGTNAYIYCAY